MLITNIRERHILEMTLKLRRTVVLVTGVVFCGRGLEDEERVHGHVINRPRLQPKHITFGCYLAKLDRGKFWSS